jgi:hypothetical protein
MSEPSKNDRVIQVLLDWKPHTSVELREVVGGRASTHVSDLRTRYGYDFHVWLENGSGHWMYQLKSVPHETQGHYPDGSVQLDLDA